jgi:hypothetical protein
MSIKIMPVTDFRRMTSALTPNIREFSRISGLAIEDWESATTNT